MPERDTPPGDGNVTVWRLQQLEDEIRELVKALQSATASLGASITALSNQIGTGLAALPEHYAPRREAEERHGAITERFDALDRRLDERKAAVDARLTAMDKALDDQIKSNRARIERIEQAGWAFAIGLVGTLLAALFAIFKSTVGGG